MYLVERIQFRKTVEFSRICHLAKNLYNLTNYHIRQTFFHERRWMRYRELYSLMKHNDCYKKLPAQTAQ